MGLTQKLGTIPLAIFTDASNNVGIGTAASGSYKLDVNGNSKVLNNLTISSTTNAALIAATNSTTGYTYIDIINNGASGKNYQIGVGGNAAAAGYANNLYFDLVGVGNIMTLTSGRNVGIGVTNPGLLLDVRGNISGDWVFGLTNSNSASVVYGMLHQFSGGSASNNSSSYYYYAGDSAAQRCSIRGNGGIYNFQANDSNLSDIRTKKDIIPIDSYWGKFKAIEIVKFKYKDQQHDDYNIGVIAQQVEQVAPEFVDTDYWENPSNENRTEMKSIYTTDLYHASIKVLQEAMSKIEELEAKVSALENKS